MAKMTMLFDLCWKCRNMGYTTEFLGTFTFSRPLTDAELSFLQAFSKSRRMKLDVLGIPPVLRDHMEPYTHSCGTEGAYFTQELPYGHPTILNYNEPPTGQPGLWCHWSPTPTTLAWNGTEKFYYYAEWLEYLVVHFFAPWGIQLNGAVQWQGEDPDDRGVLSMRNNHLLVHYEEGDGSEGGLSEEEEV